VVSPPYLNEIHASFHITFTFNASLKWDMSRERRKVATYVRIYGLYGEMRGYSMLHVRYPVEMWDCVRNGESMLQWIPYRDILILEFVVSIMCI
jgi:hypothetical protein